MQRDRLSATIMNRGADNSTTHSRPPIGIVVAIVVGGLLLVGRPLILIIDIPKLTITTEVPRLVHPHAAHLLVSAVIEGLLLRGMYMLRRTAVILYLALTAITLAIALINLGSAGWFGLAVRSAIVAPSLYYWRLLH